MTENNTPGTIITAAERRALHDHSHRMVDMLREQCEKAKAYFTLPEEEEEDSPLHVIVSYAQQQLTQGISSLHASPQMHSTLAGQDFAYPLDTLYNFNQVLAGRKGSNPAEKSIVNMSNTLVPIFKELSLANLLFKDHVVQPYIESLHKTEAQKLEKGLNNDVYIPMSNETFIAMFDKHATQIRSHINKARTIITDIAKDAGEQSSLTHIARIYEGVFKTVEETLDKTHEAALHRPVDPSKQLPPH